MPFNFNRLLDIVKLVSGTRTFQKAGELAVEKIGERIDASAHDPKAVKEIAREMMNDAPAIIGAIVKGTEAQRLVDPAIIHRKPDEATASG